MASSFAGAATCPVLIVSTFLLDTNVFASLAAPVPNRRLRNNVDRFAARLVTASVVAHEIWFGLARLPRSRRRERLEVLMTDLLAIVPMLPYGEEAARWHALERARLESLGRTTSATDAQIAAVAAVNDAVMVTSNTRHFAAFDGLRIEDWSRA